MLSSILFLESLATIAGGQRVLIDLMPALSECFNVMTVVPSNGPLADELRSRGAQVIVVPMAEYTLVNKNWRDLLNFAVETPRLTWALMRIIRQKNAKLIYINNARAFTWGTLGARLSGCPVIWHAHGVLADAKSRALVSRLAQFKNVRKIICPSDAAAVLFAKSDKVSIVPSGIDVAHFAPSPTRRRTARAELRILPDEIAIGIIGDLIPLKGQDVLIRAAAEAASQLPTAKFLIAGDVRPTEESRQFRRGLEGLAAHNPSLTIRFLGFQPDIVSLLNALDLLVVASTTETGPLVLLEALACGVPVVSTPVGMAPGLLSDGMCGALFPINDSTALARKMTQLASQPDTRREMGTSARQRAVEQLDLKHFQARIAAIVEATIRRSYAH